MSYKIFHMSYESRPRKVNRVTAITRVVEGGKVHVSFAFCGTKDRFTRAKGVMIARNRMENGNFYEVPFSGHSQDDMIELYNAGFVIERPRQMKNTILVRNSNHKVEIVKHVN